MKAQAGLCSVAQCTGHSLELSSIPCPQQCWSCAGTGSWGLLHGDLQSPQHGAGHSAGAVRNQRDGGLCPSQPVNGSLIPILRVIKGLSPNPDIENFLS